MPCHESWGRERLEARLTVTSINWRGQGRVQLLHGETKLGLRSCEQARVLSDQLKKMGKI